MSQPAVSSRLKSLATVAYDLCSEVPLDIHAHRFRHARASHWLEEGVNIVQISLLNLDTTMTSLDVTMDQKLAALETIKDNNAADPPKNGRKTNPLSLNSAVLGKSTKDQKR